MAGADRGLPKGDCLSSSYRNFPLEWTAAPVRPDRLVPLVTVSDDLSTGTVTAKSESTAVEIEAELVEDGATTRHAMTVGKGLGGYACTLTVAKPRLWWPVGHGLQERYTLRVRLLLDGAVIAERTVRIGFRRARFDQSPHPEGGRFFVLEINNRRIFCKGGNFVPADSISSYRPVALRRTARPRLGSQLQLPPGLGRGSVRA